MLLFAEYLQNPGQAAVKNPAVWIKGDTIHFAGPAPDLPQEAKADTDVYQIDGVIFPGLINAHCHLELSHLENLPYPGEFVAWIRQVLAYKYRETEPAPDRVIARGALLSLLGGTTTIGDHMSWDADPAALIHSPLRGRIFLEVLGVVEEVAKDLCENSFALAGALSSSELRFTLQPSPHSVHALFPAVLKNIFSQSHELLSIHLGESETEQKYFAEGKGSLADLILERGSPLLPTAPSALRVLEQAGLLDNRVLAVHGNYFNYDELQLCAQRGISIVHCALSHQYFGHRPFPIEQTRQLGINVALGTDSLASSRSLNMLDVLRATQENFPRLSREEVFSMATLGGAKALKMSGEIGGVVPAKKADLIGVRRGTHEEPLQALFGAEQVEFSMVGGRILIG